jgi:hypothetical protein
MRVEVVTKVYAGNREHRKGKMFRKTLTTWVLFGEKPLDPADPSEESIKRNRRENKLAFILGSAKRWGSVKRRQSRARLTLKFRLCYKQRSRLTLPALRHIYRIY